MGCCPTPIVIKPTQIYCPPPSPTVWEKVDKAPSIPFLLTKLLEEVEYAKNLELQIQCYETVLGISK
jgi:hypothetical protein